MCSLYRSWALLFNVCVILLLNNESASFSGRTHVYEQPFKGSKYLKGQDVHGSGYFPPAISSDIF